VLAALRERPRTMQHLSASMEMDEQRGAALVAGLVADGLVERRGRLVHLSGD
jgi:predicted transcriptional regulator